MPYSFYSSPRITGKLKGHNGILYSIDIYSEVDTQRHFIEEIPAGGFQLEWKGGDMRDPLYPIVSSSLDLAFTVGTNDALEAIREMTAAGDKSTYIHVHDDGGWSWYGQLVSTEVNYLITDSYTEVQLVFADGLALLKELDYRVDTDIDFHTLASEEDGLEYQTGRTGLGIVNNILSKIPWYSELLNDSNAISGNTTVIRESIYLRHSGMTNQSATPLNPYKALLPTTGFNPAAFVEKLTERQRRRRARVTPNWNNCYDVLADILQSIGCKICWNGYEWHIYSPLAISKDHSYANAEDSTLDLYHTKSFVWGAGDFDTLPGGFTDGTFEEFDAKRLEEDYHIVDGSDIAFSTGSVKYIGIHENGSRSDLVHKKPLANGNQANRQFFLGNDQYRPLEQTQDSDAFMSAGTEYEFDGTFELHYNPEMDSQQSDAQSHLFLGFIAIKLEVNTNPLPGDSDQESYLLQGDVLKTTDPQLYVGTSMTAAQAASLIATFPVSASLIAGVGQQVFANANAYPFYTTDNNSLDELTWVENTGGSLGTKYGEGGVAYFPIYYKDTGVEHSEDVLTHREFDGQMWYHTPLITTNSANNTEFLRVKTPAPKPGVFKFRIKDTLPGLPVDSRGWSMKIGYMGMDGTTSTQEAMIDSLATNAADRFDSGTYQDSGDAYRNSDQGPQLEKFDIWHYRLGLPQQGEADTTITINTGGDLEMEVMSTRIAGKVDGSGGDNSIAVHTWWNNPDSDDQAQGWMSDSYWIDWQALSDYNTSNYSSIWVVLQDLFRTFSNGFYYPTLQLTPKYERAHHILTPDIPLFAKCITGNEDFMYADTIKYKPTVGLDLEGLIYSQNIADVTTDEDTVTPGGVITPGGGSPWGGGLPVAPGVKEDAFVQDLLTGSGMVTVDEGKVTYVTGAANNVPAYVGGKWISRTPAGVASYMLLDDIGDVTGLTRSGADDGKVLSYNATNNNFEFVAATTTGTGSGTSVSVFIDTDAALSIDTFAATNDGAEYSYKMKDSTNGYIRTGRLYIVHNGSDAHVSDVSTITMGGETSIPDFTANVSGGTVTLYCTNGSNYDFTATRNLL